MNSIRKYLFLFIAIVLAACSEEETPVRLNDADYFPLRVGMFMEYNVLEKQYSQTNGEQTFEYELKQMVVDSFPNSSGGITYVLNRFKRDNPSEDYEYVSTWSARVEGSQVVLNEENISFVVLAFPLGDGKEWNGNSLNSIGGGDLCGDENDIPCDIYKVAAADEEFEFNGERFDAITIAQNDNQDVIVKQDVRMEQYARNLGLVYKMSTVLEYCTVGDCIGKQEIEKGFIFEQRLSAIGFE